MMGTRSIYKRPGENRQKNQIPCKEGRFNPCGKYLSGEADDVRTNVCGKMLEGHMFVSEIVQHIAGCEKECLELSTRLTSLLSIVLEYQLEAA